MGEDITIPELRQSGYKAFFIAVGAQGGRTLDLDYEDAMNVSTGIDFLKNVSLGTEPKLTGKTLVIGGGNVAIDVARTAVRYVTTVTMMACLESRETMPALKDESHEALEENIEILNGYGPLKLIAKDGKVTQVVLRKCLSTLDEHGRFNPVFDDSNVITIDVDHVLIAVGQSMKWDTLLHGTKAELNKNRTIKVDPETLQSTDPDIFAGGDAQTGPKFAIHAIASGKEAAISIHRFVQRGQSLVFGRKRNLYTALDPEKVDFSGYDHARRERTYTLEKKHDLSFNDPRGTLTEEQVKTETKRCLSCGITIFDPFMCVGCGACTTRCKFDAIKLVKTRNETGVDFPDLKKVVMKHAIKRKLRIAVKEIGGKIVKRDDHA